ARSAAHSLRKRLARVGITEAHAADVALWDVYKSYAAAAAGTIRFPWAHRWKAAKNEIKNLARDERLHHRGRDERFFDRGGLDRNGRRRVRGIWRSPALATQD